MKNLRNTIPLTICALLLTVLYTPGCAILQNSPETQDFDWELIGQLIPDLINSDQLTGEERLDLLEKAKGATTDPQIIARIDREIARQKARNEAPAPEAPAPDAPDAPAPGVDEAFFQSVNWLQRDVVGTHARVTKRLDNLQLKGNRLSFTALNIPDWPSGSSGNVKGVICIAAVRNGVWSGGKFEHIRNNMTSRDLGNVLDGYVRGLSISRGEKLRFWILSYDGRQASNVVEVVWQ